LPLKEEAESARLVSKNYSTPYRWIDQPEVLARHGARSYQSQIRGKIETLLGAEKLFKELMDFLLERVEPGIERDENPALARRRNRKLLNEDDETKDGPIPPAADAFITDTELVESLRDGLNYHQPYDRSLSSLQDLLSLVLLRLTARTQPIPVEDDLTDEEREQKTQEEQEEERVDILQRLREYLVRYCTRYADHLVNAEFLEHVSPEVIFQNHYTLCKVLLEFENKTGDPALFSQEDIVECFWKIWAPLAWPEIIGLEGNPTLRSFMKGHKPDVVRKAWQSSGMPGLAILMFCEVLRQPPSWQAGLWQPEDVATFVFAREWISRIRKLLGENAFNIQPEDVEKLMGIQSVVELYVSPVLDTSMLEYSSSVFQKLESYQVPVEEKYSPLIGLYNLEKTPDIDPVMKQRLIEEIYSSGLVKEYDTYQSIPKPIMPTKYFEDEIYCPRCGAEQTEIASNSLEKGELVLCTSGKDVWMYLQPQLPDRVM